MMEPPWEMAITANFGSPQAWRDQFTSMARSAGDAQRVLLSFKPREGTLVNELASGESPAESVPILVYEVQREPAGIDAFMQTIDHAKAYLRYQDAVHAASEGLACGPDDVARAQVFDVRRDGAFEKATHVIEGAKWRDPAKVGEWSTDLAPSGDVVVYCVYGHEVCRATALRLRAAGVNARFLEGGIDEWEKRGGPLQPK
jgi:Fe-Mn family superoxide dismutase